MTCSRCGSGLRFGVDIVLAGWLRDQAASLTRNAYRDTYQKGATDCKKTSD